MARTAVPERPHGCCRPVRLAFAVGGGTFQGSPYDPCAVEEDTPVKAPPEPQIGDGGEHNNECLCTLL